MTQMPLIETSAALRVHQTALGQVFTPPALVDFILDQAGYVVGEQLFDQTLLEPSCGDGAFLSRAAARLAHSVDVVEPTLAPASRAARIAELWASNLWGQDLDARAVTAARDALTSLYAVLTGRALKPRVLERNIVVDDFLLGERATRASPRADLLYDFVVGNPPYVSTQEITGSHREELRGRFHTASGRLDLYGLFMERSVSLLKERGRLAFIVPDKFLMSRSAAPLRAFLKKQGSVRSIARFDSAKVFVRAATVPCVFVFGRAEIQPDFQSLECEYRNGVEPGRIVITREERLSPSRLEGDVWRTKEDTLERVATKVLGVNPRLDSVAARISAGVATGRDGIFVVDGNVAKEIEPELLRPALRGRDIGRFSVNDPQLWLLLPYLQRDGKPYLADLNAFPRAKRYLSRHRTELEKRHCVRAWEKAWFDLHDPIWGDVSGTPKVLVPDVADSPRFAFDPGKFCPLHSAYYIVPERIDGQYLAALLNSEPIEFLLRLRSPVVKDGFNRYRRQFLMDLPVPVVRLSSQRALVAAAARGDFEALNDEAYRLFGLTPTDRKVILAYLSRVRTPRASGRGDRE